METTIRFEISQLEQRNVQVKKCHNYAPEEKALKPLGAGIASYHGPWSGEITRRTYSVMIRSKAKKGA